ncbi:MAG TPA: MSMEG_4193 family putative phosphomutase [Chloroflexi bacterium]|nr:MSMEG_4193 family putative phosphomutase [Chloroflexota bacterium]
MADATIVLLIRHGENEYVATHRLAGRTAGVHLNDKGRAQADQLVSYLADQPLAAIYSSPLVRCIETATPLAQARSLPLIEDSAFLEVDYGAWQGADLRELAKLEDWRKVQQTPSTFRFPGGESLREVQHRAVTGVEAVRHQHPNQVVAIFAHGDVIRTTLAHYLGVPLDLFQRIVIQTASVSVLSFHDGAASILGMNYLAGLPKFEIKPPDAGTLPGQSTGMTDAAAVLADAQSVGHA